MSDLATGPESTRHLLDALVDEQRQRYELLRARELRSWSVELGPWLLVVVDELAEVVGLDRSEGAKAKDHAQHRAGQLERLARLGRAAGITLISATQRPSQAVLPESFRDQHSYRLCLAVREPATAAMVLGGSIPGVEPHRLGFDRPGTGYLVADGARPRLARGFYVSDDTASGWAAATAYLAPVPPWRGQSRGRG